MFQLYLLSVAQVGTSPIVQNQISTTQPQTVPITIHVSQSHPLRICRW